MIICGPIGFIKYLHLPRENINHSKMFLHIRKINSEINNYNLETCHFYPNYIISRKNLLFWNLIKFWKSNLGNTFLAGELIFTIK